MEPNKIFSIMDLARRARSRGEIFNPLFVGPPGVAKSYNVKEWCKRNNLPFIDLRIAYMEAPDLIGFPSIELANGRQVTVHNLPEFLPVEGEGVLLLEEPNRGTTSVMNCLMQLLTDRKIHKYELPEGWIIASCINPEGDNYDVNAMDNALKDRFEIFPVSYDKKSFVNYMTESKWNKEIINFVEANLWTYKTPEEIGNVAGAKYISPRTKSKLNAAMNAGFDKEDELMIYETILGRNVAKDFYHFRHNESPVTMAELRKNMKTSLKRLAEFSDPANYKNGFISITVKDILEDNSITDDELVAVAKTIPVEQGTSLIRDLEFKRKDTTILERLCAADSDLKKLFKSVLRYGK